MVAAAIALAASGTAVSASVAVIGAAANLAAKPHQLSDERLWLRRGGFVGVLNGRGGGVAAPAPPAPPAAAPPAAAPPASAPKASGTPIGGRPAGPPLKAPFGTFPKHAPSKLPGPPPS